MACLANRLIPQEMQQRILERRTSHQASRRGLVDNEATGNFANVNGCGYQRSPQDNVIPLSVRRRRAPQQHTHKAADSPEVQELQPFSGRRAAQTPDGDSDGYGYDADDAANTTPGSATGCSADEQLRDTTTCSGDTHKMQEDRAEEVRPDPSDFDADPSSEGVVFSTDRTTCSAFPAMTQDLDW